MVPYGPRYLEDRPLAHPGFQLPPPCPLFIRPQELRVSTRVSHTSSYRRKHFESSAAATFYDPCRGYRSRDAKAHLVPMDALDALRSRFSLVSIHLIKFLASSSGSCATLLSCFVNHQFFASTFSRCLHALDFGYSPEALHPRKSRHRLPSSYAPQPGTFSLVVPVPAGHPIFLISPSLPNDTLPPAVDSNNTPTWQCSQPPSLLWVVNP